MITTPIPGSPTTHWRSYRSAARSIGIDTSGSGSAGGASTRPRGVRRDRGGQGPAPVVAVAPRRDRLDRPRPSSGSIPPEAPSGGRHHPGRHPDRSRRGRGPVRAGGRVPPGPDRRRGVDRAYPGHSGVAARLAADAPGVGFLATTPNATSAVNLLLSALGRENNHPDHLQIYSYKTLATLAGRIPLHGPSLTPYYYDPHLFRGRLPAFAAPVVSLTDLVVLKPIQYVFPLTAFGWILEGTLRRRHGPRRTRDPALAVRRRPDLQRRAAAGRGPGEPGPGGGPRGRGGGYRRRIDRWDLGCAGRVRRPT